jgi:hypothetical protein
MTFEDVLAGFWDAKSDYLVQPPLTEEALRETERELGVALPEAYVTLLRQQNGGVVSDAYSAFPMSEPTGWAPDHVAFGDMMGIGRDFETIGSSTYWAAEWELPSPVVMLTGEGHWWIALDYRAGGEPSVVWLDSERDEDIQLAPCFRAFVEGLVPREVYNPPEDLDVPPPRRKQSQSSIGGVVMAIGMDVEVFEEGRRSMENTKLWCRHRCSEVRRHLWPWQTRRLRAALDAVDAAHTPEELVARMRAVEPELDRLLPAWIRKRRGGWAGDEQRLRKLRGR